MLLLFIPCVTYALTMCARDNSLVISLTPSTTVIDKSYNAADYVWRFDLGYGAFLGEATCMSDPEYEAYTNSLLSYDVPKGLKGTDSEGYGRGHCMCRMVHPVLSRWIHILADIPSDCIRDCARRCSESSGGLKHYFNSIGR